MSDKTSETPLLSVRNLYKRFDISGGLLDQIKFKNGKFKLEQTLVKALNNVSIDIKKGETFSVVGESGCGKSTLGRTIMGLYPPNGGEIYYKGERIDNLSPKKMLPYRSKMQMVFQDPYASLNPRKTIKQTLEGPLKYHNPHLSPSEVKDRIEEVMLQVGSDPKWISRMPHEFSGGQRQRISIARALVVDPEFIVADEPISALDVSIQAQILNLLMDAQEQRNLTYLFVAHDLSVVEHISTNVVVMYLGTVCELAETSLLFGEPKHPYTKALLSAIPTLDGRKSERLKLTGEVPTPINLPSGCVFHGRCPYADGRCREEIPALIQHKDGRKIACHAVEEGRI
ncbi:oligopeptide/dipeptide ABC transporter, ATPase subunit [Denitrovibrio acetiphilus DSM 12809]|uniref:Oligopeptide/dipeptide ABC transporter, ATPase subunit n=1 Tax=Denitrovibrio acetiphilus (strain DSM 12809 / NBRC 114555 / N2460) TaxID=522772 RepID=D4H4D5_DENA2|nr:oligopeptide/dipeptide ABC transporter ATP-binding protein [Denitrovibrio acetiphilus]ADD69264.1 oligopeptide/dipeptide ABC transporter, ATPase subunit [Denitrovibrio acetiphilus DSM 12809]